jgi:hypothetical protein
MIPELRKEFNAAFSREKYDKFIRDMNSGLRYPADFRISETPVFLTRELTNELIKASDGIVQQLRTDEFKSRSQSAIPKGLFVPGEDDHPLFLSIDFAVCNNRNGRFIPSLIELQGFPTVYAYQAYYEHILRKHFEIPSGFSAYFDGLEEETYLKTLRDAIVGEADPENVILMEIEPEKQKTRIDFAATEKFFGVRTVDISEIKQDGKTLFYKHGSRLVPINKIYNRVIFDELKRKNIHYNFDITQDLRVSWAGHPNWFFKISKYSLPLLKSKYVPECYYLNELEKYPDNLSEYVLKPLFSFAGLGVLVDVTGELLDKIKDRENYILQRKVEYAPVIETPGDEQSKIEIRMMFIWQDKPVLVNNLVRMSKGKMMGVDFNKNKTWVGSSCAYHPV